MQDSSHRLKESIAKCAIGLFKAEGYNNVSVNEICEAAHVSRSVFYTLFKGKRSILDYVVAKPPFTALPSRMTTSVGMLLTPKRCARPGFSSTSTLHILTLP